VSDYCLTPKEHQGKDNLHFNEMIDGDVRISTFYYLNQPIQLVFIELAHLNNIPQVESWLHSDTNQIPSQSVYELASLYCVLSGEANPSFIVWFNPTIYRTRGKQATPKWLIVFGQIYHLKLKIWYNVYRFFVHMCQMMYMYLENI